MLFIVSWKGSSENRNAIFKRFAKTGGPPPKGVKMLGRWHAAGSSHGVAIAEAADAALVQQWMLDWSDLLEMDVRPALTDEQIGKLIAGVLGKK
jgi:hypothetical protein